MENYERDEGSSSAKMSRIRCSRFERGYETSAEFTTEMCNRVARKSNVAQASCAFGIAVIGVGVETISTRWNEASRSQTARA